MADEYPGDPRDGGLGDDDHARERFFARHGERPCPALAADGRCDLYEARPVSCRTFGPPVRFGERDLPPCPLCFTDASTADVERCRLEPDAEGLEDGLLAALEPSGSGDFEKTVAFALVAGRR